MLYNNLISNQPMPDDLQEWEELFLKALKERKEKPPEDKQQPNNTLPAVIAAVL